jgi:hypothetical protein
MPFCSNCGASLKEDQHFCQSCGKEAAAPSGQRPKFSVPVSPTQPQSTAQFPQSFAAAEPLKYILTEIKYIPNKEDRPVYTLLLTDQRIIFARLTPQISQEAGKMMQVNDQGKGFFGKWKSQVSGHDWVRDRYTTITPEQALRETADNFTVYHSSVRSVLIKYWSDDQGGSEYYFEMLTDSQLIKFCTIRSYEKEFGQVYAKLVKRKNVS